MTHDIGQLHQLNEKLGRIVEFGYGDRHILPALAKGKGNMLEIMASRQASANRIRGLRKFLPLQAGESIVGRNAMARLGK